VPTEIDAAEVQRLVQEDGALLLDVLSEREFEEEHLPGATNIPLKRLTGDALRGIDHARPVIAYCHDDL
jgi:rhodanese-related sulfurtransferase